MKGTRMIGSRMRIKMLIESMKTELHMYKEVEIRLCGVSLSIEAISQTSKLDSKEVLCVDLVTDSIVDILTCPDADLRIKIADFCMDTKAKLRDQLLKEAASRVINIYQYY